MDITSPKDGVGIGSGSAQARAFSVASGQPLLSLDKPSRRGEVLPHGVVSDGPNRVLDAGGMGA